MRVCVNGWPVAARVFWVQALGVDGGPVMWVTDSQLTQSGDVSSVFSRFNICARTGTLGHVGALHGLRVAGVGLLRC